MELAALEHLQAGRLAQAETLYQQILLLEPNHADALNYSGLIAQQRGDNQTALDLIGRAIDIKPDHAFAHFSFGNVLLDLNRHEEALHSYDRALRCRPDFVEAFYNRGSALLDVCRYEEALASFDRALQIKQDFAEALYNRGNALLALGRHEEALASYDRTLRFKPDFAEALYNRGKTLRALDRPEEALGSYDRVLQLMPNFAEAHNNHGNALRDLNRHEEALAAYERALQFKPHYADAHNNRGTTLLDLDRPEEALANYERALQCKPDHADAFNNRGNTLLELNRLEEALASYEQALRLQPDFAEAYLNESKCRLLSADLALGWQEYEWRWHCNPQKKSKRDFNQPLWLGKENLHGKTILLHAEQGLGDTIQFCRYARLVAAQGATVLLEVQTPLKLLLTGLNGVSRIIAQGEQLPDFDYHCPLLSLPLALGTTIETIPCEIPYLTAQPELIRKIDSELKEHKKFRVGICWSGNAMYSRDKKRSPGIEPFKRLMLATDAEFYTLMPNGREEFLKAGGEDIGYELDQATAPFAETAALIMNLDLVITCDTSIGHLAGALGKPVWLILSFVSDWRWMMYREDSPWYPNTRLFRQTVAGDWPELFERVALRLREVMSGSAGPIWPVVR